MIKNVQNNFYLRKINTTFTESFCKCCQSYLHLNNIIENEREKFNKSHFVIYLKIECVHKKAHKSI